MYFVSGDCSIQVMRVHETYCYEDNQLTRKELVFDIDTTIVDFDATAQQLENIPSEVIELKADNGETVVKTFNDYVLNHITKHWEGELSVGSLVFEQAF
jgi:hypothetical protein